ncbi:zinc finger protein with KRAB and SCAN domains 1-like [Brienomyrus brachyistius]|uniref:zinc finger protein with KRAB and SCAN domains 1-like n=1 Tax=Brienomyrus brachyistius TaxID=42636 RepID=UPI0020B182C9|nr:zinc finger protein with KRAB and SCAN domains 1-like [Brienomyrus brachyistius]
MLNCALFHSQIASIVEVLAKTAIAEICELVDNGYAALQTEISRSQKENKALKRELQTTKQRLAQQEKKNGSPQAPVNTGYRRVKICDELRGIAGKEVFFPNEESQLYRKSDGSQGEDRDHAFVEEEYGMVKSALKVKPTQLEEESRDLLIKQEGHEEDFGSSKLHGCLNVTGVLVESGAAETVPVLAKQSTPTQDPGLHFEQQRTGQLLDRSHLDTLVHAGSENEPFNQSFEHQGSEQSSAKMDSVRNKYFMNDRSDQLNVLLSPLNSGRRTRQLMGSYATELNSQRVSADSEPPLGPFSDEYDDDSLCSLVSQDEKPDLIMIDSASMEFELQPEEIEETTSESAQNQHERYRERSRGEKGNYLHKGLSHSHALEEQSTAFCDPQNITGNVFYEKSLNMLRSAEIYQEAETVGGRFVGTGPFNCLLCGKTFSQLSQLKKHQLVHTGEEQFKCAKCGKCFANSSNLKRHQTVHTGERPFSCAQCGKRFSFVGNLKRHQSVHIRKKLPGSSALEEEV